jgi:hypothetical protein
MKLLLLPIAVAATILTYAASHHVLKTFTALGHPRLIAGIVALLSGVSLLSLGDGVITLILIPYAALGLSLLFLPLLKWLVGSGAGRDLERWFQDQSPGSPRRRPGGNCQPGSPQSPASAHLRETPPNQE